jgi:hypothetical protein
VESRGRLKTGELFTSSRGADYRLRCRCAKALAAMDFDRLLLCGLLRTLAALLATFPLVTLHLLNSLTPFHLSRYGLEYIAKRIMQIILAIFRWHCRFMSNE